MVVAPSGGRARGANCAAIEEATTACESAVGLKKAISGGGLTEAINSAVEMKVTPRCWGEGGWVVGAGGGGWPG